MSLAVGSPIFFDAASVARHLPWDRLVEALHAGFASEARVPQRSHHDLELGARCDQVLLVMPAWSEALGIGTKLITVFPGNEAAGIASIQGLYVLLDPANGRPVAVLDGGELTARRTAATSALASRFLSRPDSRTLLVVGTGRLAAYLPFAHASVRPIERVIVWGRSPDKAAATARRIAGGGLAAEAATSLGAAIAAADIISCATMSTEPIVTGRHVKPGTHIDLIGAYKASMREADDEVMARAAMVWADTLEGVRHEGGDVIQALSSGALRPDRLLGELADLCRGAAVERRPADITAFKSVGAAIEDLAAARLCVDSAAGTGEAMRP